MNKIWGNKDDELKRQFLLELQTQLNTTDLIKSQLQINQAEASNPNRKYITWRELIGYICAFSFGWTYLLQPMITYVVVVLGFTAPSLPALDMSQLMMLLGTMLGVGGLKTFERVKGVTQK